MALQCNKAVTTNSGTVPSGSYVKPTARFYRDSYDVAFDLSWYIDKATYDADNNDNFVIKNIPSMGVVKKLTEEEFNDATGVGVDTKVEFNNFAIEKIVEESNGYFVASDFQVVQ